MNAPGEPVIAIRAVEFGVSDLERSSRFYREVWALEDVGRFDDAQYLRASGPEHHVLVLREAEQPGLAGVEFALRTRSGVDRLFERLESRGADKPAALERPGGGYGFAMVDPRGRAWRFTADVESHAQWSDDPERPFKISHAVVNSADITADVRFAVEDMGFRLRDESKAMFFLGCNSDHHSLAFARSDRAGLNHVAFDVPSIDAVMRNAGRLKRHGHRMEWGVGRHGPGANVFSYYLDPDGLAIEYTAEMQQVDDATYRPGTPKDWERPPFFDAWGVTEPPTQNLRDAMSSKRSEQWQTASR